LQALVALGGRQVSKTRLADIFWPDSNGDEQLAALKTTLHRLRQLLGMRNVIIQTTTTLSLNGALCWVDCWQFERMASRALTDNNITKEERKTEIAQASARYRGEFLPFLNDESWSFSYRSHLSDLTERLSKLEATMG
jgi:two-component SAPR family response regulator